MNFKSLFINRLLATGEAVKAKNENGGCARIRARWAPMSAPDRRSGHSNMADSPLTTMIPLIAHAVRGIIIEKQCSQSYAPQSHFTPVGRLPSLRAKVRSQKPSAFPLRLQHNEHKRVLTYRKVPAHAWHYR